MTVHGQRLRLDVQEKSQMVTGAQLQLPFVEMFVVKKCIDN